MMIVVKTNDLPILGCVEEYHPIFDEIGIGVDIFLFTEDELENPIAQNELSSGVILFDRWSE